MTTKGTITLKTANVEELARLIAAASDLLEACEEALEGCDLGVVERKHMLAAVAKAKGV